MISASFRWLIVLSGLAYAWVAAQTTPPAPAVPIPELRSVAPLPAVIDATAKANVSTDGIHATTRTTGLVANDTATVLVHYVDGDEVRQWAVQLVGKAPSEKERAMVWPPFKLYLTTGREVTFPGTTAAIAIHVLGPYRDGAKPAKRARDRWSGTLLKEQFLGLGLDRACECMIKLQKPLPRPVPNGVSLSAGCQPFREIDFGAVQACMTDLGITAEDERAFAGMVPALLSFFQIAAQTPEVNDILFTVLDVPWWSLVRKMGKMPDISMRILKAPSALTPADWGLPVSAPCYAFAIGLDLNQHPALTLNLAVTAPRPPLLITAGIVGIAVQRPDGKGPSLMIRLVSAHTAAEPATAAPSP